MDNFHYFDNVDPHLPPGYRFHPTDEELITYYLLNKVLDSNFTGKAIAEVDLNKCEPWELPGNSFSLFFLFFQFLINLMSFYFFGWSRVILFFLFQEKLRWGRRNGTFSAYEIGNIQLV